MQLSKRPLTADMGIDAALEQMAEPKELDESGGNLIVTYDGVEMSLSDAMVKHKEQFRFWCRQMLESSEKVRIAIFDEGGHRERIDWIAFEIAAGRADDSEYGATVKCAYEYYCSKDEGSTKFLINDMVENTFKPAIERMAA